VPSTDLPHRIQGLRVNRREVLRYAVIAGVGLVAIPLIGCGKTEYSPPTAKVFWRRWFGPAAAPGKVEWKGTEVLGAAAPNKTTVTVNELQGWINDGSCWAADVQRAYIVSVTEPFNLVRFNPADNTYTAYTAPSGYNNAWGVCTTGGKVYVPSSDVADKISVSVFLTSYATPVLDSVHEYDAAGQTVGDSNSIATDGTYLYVGSGYGLILMVRLSDMVLVYTLTLTHARNVHAIGYNPTDGFLYCGGGTGVNKEVASKISIDRSGETLTETAHYHHNCGGMTDDVAFSSTHAWFGPEGGIIHGQVLLIPLATFASHELVTCGPPDAYCNGSFLDWDGLHMWTCWYMGTHTGLTRTTLNDMTHERLWLADDEINPNEVVQYDTNKYLIATYQSPNKVINLTNPFPDVALKRPGSGSSYSYWVPIRPYVEVTPDDSISSLVVYTDGSNGLGTGWSGQGNSAKEYTQPTGTEGVTGDVLNTTNYPSLDGAPVDIFTWDSGTPNTLGGSLSNPNVGDIGTAGTDGCFVVLQLAASSSVAGGLSKAEDITAIYSESYHQVAKIMSIRGNARRDTGQRRPPGQE
jgi:hypothetical protein